MNARVLLVDDDRQICASLAQFLGEHGHSVTTVSDGPSMLEKLDSRNFDLVLLDVSLPGADGVDLCRRLRSTSGIPVIFLTARSGEVDRIVGLEVGADDYICKPFNPRELLARIRAVARRSGGADVAKASPIYEFLGWRLDRGRRTLRSVANGLVDLTASEFDLLVIFAEHAQRIVTRERLLDMSRGAKLGPFDRRIDVQISRLRRKIETNPQQPELIKTVRGDGYIFTAPVRTGSQESTA